MLRYKNYTVKIRCKMSNEGITIRVSHDLHGYLVEQGRKSESFDLILKRLLHLDKKES